MSGIGESADNAGRTVVEARGDAHVWIDRVFDAAEGFVRGIGEVMRGAADVATGRRPTRSAPFETSHVADLGEWYTDTVLDASTGHTVYVVTNGERVVECNSREMAAEVVAALNERGVRTRAREEKSP